MLISSKSEWDSDKMWKKLQARSERQPSAEDQTIGCLNWTGQLDQHGYGVISIFGRKYCVHTASLFVKEDIRDFPKDHLGRRMVVRHICSSKKCCEPSHLELGTYEDNNITDKIRDGTLLFGENNPATKITEELAKAIKMSWKPLKHEDYVSIGKRAEQFGVSRAIVVSIDYGKSWTHVAGNNDEIIHERNQQIRKDRELIRKGIREKGLTKQDLIELKKRIENKSETEMIASKLETPCRLWTAWLQAGYGRIRYKHMCLSAHTTICEVTHGPRPEGKIARHLCGNKACVNADHLVWGTPKTNAHDAIDHGHLIAKLNFEKATEIRAVLMDDCSKETKTELAEKYGVSVRTISGLKHNNHWIREKE